MFVQMLLQHMFRPGVCCVTGNVPHLRVIVSYAFDTFSQVDCVSGGIFGKLMGSHEQWLWTVFFFFFFFFFVLFLFFVFFGCFFFFVCFFVFLLFFFVAVVFLFFFVFFFFAARCPNMDPH